jgi:HK97 family phage major capsid protein
MRRALRKLKDTAGRPIWLPSYDAGISNLSRSAQQGGFTGQEAPVVYDYLLGYPVWVNNDMAVPAASAKSMLFGDLSYYKIRDAMDVLLFRFTDSAYAKLGQVGFLAWLRTGGNLVDTAAVKYYQNSAT